MWEKVSMKKNKRGKEKKKKVVDKKGIIRSEHAGAQDKASLERAYKSAARR